MNSTQTTDDNYEATLADLIRSKLAALDRDNYPVDGLCSHLGISMKCGDDIIGLSDYKGMLLITMYRGDSKYQKNARGDTEVIGYSKKEHVRKAKIAAVAASSEIHKTWNGYDGSDGISVCLWRSCPASLSVAISNYGRIPNVFKLTDAESQRFKLFKDWLNGADCPASPPSPTAASEPS